MTTTVTYRTKKEAIAAALEMGLPAECVSGGNKKYIINVPTEAEAEAEADEFMKTAINSLSIDELDDLTSRADEIVTDEEMAATFSARDLAEINAENALEFVNDLTDEEAATIEVELDAIYNDCDPARVSVPHDLAEGEADQSTPIDMGAIDAEMFARIFIAKRSAPVDADADAEFFNSVTQQKGRVAQKRATISAKEQPGKYVGQRCNYPKRDGRCKQQWDLLTQLWNEAGQPLDFNLTAEMRKAICEASGWNLSSFNADYRMWRFYFSLPVKGRAGSAPVANEVEPVSVDDVEVTEV